MKKLSQTFPGEPFVNAQEMHQLHPDTFDAPSLDDLRKLQPGNSVKVATSGERFWVTLTKVIGGMLTGVVDNDLIDTHRHGLKLGDEIHFRIENVYDIIS